MKPIAEMQTEPYGLPMMFSEWIGLVLFLAEQPEVRAHFERDSGHSLLRIFGAGGIEAMVDKATGYDKAVLVAFCDWVTKNYWGEDGVEPDEEVQS